MSKTSTDKQTNKQKNQIENLISVKELMSRLSVSRATVHRLKKKIRHFNVGDRLLFSWSDVEAYLLENCAVTPSNRRAYRPRIALPNETNSNGEAFKEETKNFNETKAGAASASV